MNKRSRQLVEESRTDAMIRLWAGRGKECPLCGSSRLTWRIRIDEAGELWACECRHTWTCAAPYRVCLSLDSEEAGVVMDALMEHQRTNERRHAEATSRGDTVSTTDVRVGICLRVLEQLLRHTL